jgi:hypothetical protein
MAHGESGRPARYLASLTYFPFHPLLATLFPVLSLYAHNIDETPPGVIWRPLGYALLSTLIVWAAAAIPFRQLRRAAVVTTFVSLIFFSYGHIANQIPPDKRILAAPICIGTIIALTAAVWKFRDNYLEATRVLNLAAVVLLAPSLFSISGRIVGKWYGADQSTLRDTDLISADRSGVDRGGAKSKHNKTPRTITALQAEALPDIYYIVLDAYGRQDSLKQFYGYDNTPFIAELEKRGFYVAKQSRANYPKTSYCLPTSLNMNYLDKLLPIGRSERFNAETMRRLIDENAVADYLRDRGYHYVYLWTGIEATRVDTADLELDNSRVAPPSSFGGELLRLTPLGGRQMEPIISYGMASLYDAPRAEILTAFHNLSYVPRLGYPKFVFAHILAPHPPFIFNADGEPVTPKFPYDDADGSALFRAHNMTKQEYQEGYVGQLKYVNRRTLEAIDAIKQKSKRPPIIIVQGDHGSRMHVDWESREKTDLREPFSILNAYLVPDSVRQQLYPAITPVNSFRVLFNQMFGANYPLLPDRSYFATDDHPLEFKDVTNDILPFDSEAARAPKPIATQ